MSIGTFLKQLSLLSIGVGLFLFGLHYTTTLKEHYTISIVSIVFFVVFSGFVYLIGVKSAKNENKHVFTGVIIAFVFGKMFFSVLLVVLYHRFVNPSSNLFLIPFFIVYLFYTIFETYVMIQLGKLPSANHIKRKDKAL